MKTKMMLAAVAAIMCHAALLAGNVCTWQGGSGKFSDSSKWDTSPTSGNFDTIVFDTSDGSAITVENDVADDFSVSNVVFASSASVCGKVTLTGKRLYISGGKDRGTVVWDNGDAADNDKRGPEVDVALPLRVKSGRFNFSRNVTFKRKVTIDDDGDVALRYPGTGTYYTSDKPTVTFEAEVEGAQANLDSTVGAGGSGSDVYYKGKVTLKKFSVCATANGRTLPHLQASENDIPSVWVCYADLYLDSSPCLGTNTVVTRADNQWRNGATYITGGGAGVICDRLVSADSAKHQTVGDNNKSGKLTMKASGNASSGFNFAETLSLVWDPRDAYTYTLTDSASTMTGTLEIRGGTFKMSGSTAFSAISDVIVRSGATLDLSECSAATPIAATARLTVDLGGSIVLPTGKTIAFASGKYRGLPLSAGDYSSVWVSGGTVAISSSSMEAGVSYWANPVSGDWNVAANWLPAAIPVASDEVRVTVQGESDYTVRMTGSETKPAKIVVGTERTARAALSIEGEANFTKDTKISVNRGGEIVVPSSGKFIYDMANSASMDTILVQIENGRFVVDGGYATFTNSLGVVVVGGEDGEMLVENGGELVFADATGGTIGPLTIERGATLRMTGGSISIPSKYWNSYLKQVSGGKCDFSGGTLTLSKNGSPNQTTFYGDTVFSNSVVWDQGDARTRIYPFSDNTSMTFSVLDDATTTGDFFTFYVGGGGFGRSTTFLWGSSGSLRAKHGIIGMAKGTTLCRQTAGYVCFRDSGLCIGSTTLRDGGIGKDLADNAVEGTIEVSGGALSVSGNAATSPTWSGVRGNAFPPGLIVGYGGTLNPPASGRPYVGNMTISGTGSVTNEQGHLFVGVAPYGEGLLTMTGGVLRSGVGVSAAYQEKIGFAVGVGGGKGKFQVYGGDCQINNNAWIGGAATNAVRIKADGEASAESCTIYGYPFETHGGEGLLEVSGGSVAFGRDLVVGADGTGVVSVVGSAASQFTVGRDLVLSNEASVVVGGTSSATLKFKADANGVTPIVVAGKFVVADKATLEIDLSDCDLKSKGTIGLMTYSSKEGGFGADRIVVKGRHPDTVSVRVTDTGLSVKERNGMVLIYR